MELNPPIRAEQVGSLLRPTELLEARSAHSQWRISQELLRAVEDWAIAGALAKQRECGIGIYTDGEMRRGSWLTDMAEAVQGFLPEKVAFEWKGPGGGVEGSTAHAVGAKLRKTRKLTAHELPFLKKTAPGPFKITLPAPSNFLAASYKPGVTNKVYPSRADLLADLVEIARDEIKWLISEGVAYIQLDAPYYSRYLDPRGREYFRKTGLDPDKELDIAIAGDNATMEGVPRGDAIFAVHICRGNSRSRWLTEGGYDTIAAKLFGMPRVDRFLLEFDTKRAGTFEPLRLAPADKTIVLGLVTTKQPALESQDELLRRIDEASRFVPIENLALSPQCGFASVASGNLLSMDDQWRKLELVATTAQKVWGGK